jgi:hypothetical protein
MGIPADFHSTGINVGNYQLKIIFDIFGHKRIPADLHSTGMYVGNYQLNIIFDIFGHKRIPADLHSTDIYVGNYQLKIIFDIFGHKRNMLSCYHCIYIFSHYRHDITEILLKVTLNTINQTTNQYR